MPYLTSFDKRQLRNVLGTFTTGVTVVTTRTSEGKAYGVTANSFTSVSLEPPLVLWSQALTSKSLDAFQSTETFAVNILADDQIEVSNHFAKSRDDKFSLVAHSDSVNGLPVIDGAAAHLECTKVATYPGGDHVVYLGRVERIGHSNRRPLAYAAGRYAVPYAHDLGPVSLQVGAARIAHPEAVRFAISSMPGIAQDVGFHSVCLAVWGNHGPTTIHWEPSSRPVSGNFPTGLVLNVTSSALGRAFAAFLPAEITQRFIEEDLRLFCGPDDDPVQQREAFDREMDATRQRGMARAMIASHASRVHNIPTIAFACPIYDGSGAMIMAMSIIASVAQLTDECEGADPQALKAACARISGKLGFTAP